MSDPHPHDPALPSSLAHLGALIGDPVRAAILLHLSDGSRRPAGELATLAGASQQAVSGHLTRLLDGGLLRVEPHGRHRFYSLASGEVAETIEALVNWLDQPRRIVAHDPALRDARLCYDHLAGRLGVAIFDRMTDRGFLVLGQEGPRIAEAGRAWCQSIGLAPQSGRRTRRPEVRLCLDWTERRPHLGGRLGADLAATMRERGFINGGPHRRSVILTARGTEFLEAELGLALPLG